jgi:hypothetical protein
MRTSPLLRTGSGQQYGYLLTPKAGTLVGMALCLNMLGSSVQRGVLRKGARIFGLLGKATPLGLTCFGRNDLSRAWALTAEFGCLRLERLVGDEEVTGDQLMLPTPFSYDYGATGMNESPDLTRAIFGLLPSELEELVSALRRGSFPVLGFSHNDLRCSITDCVIPGHWPHLVTSNTAAFGNVVSLEAFVRIAVCSLPQGQLNTRFPRLQPVFKQMMKLLLVPRRGLLYTKEMLALAPSALLMEK